MSEVKIDLTSKTGTAALQESIKILQLTIDTIAGKYGNGETRKKNLGNNYSKVQSIINYLYKEGLL